MRKTEFIIIIIYRVRTIANVAAMCAIVTIMIDRAVHISVAIDMRTLLDSSSSNGQVAAHRVTGFIIKRL